jgi:glycosyltransferase involved in cell wall biosynthesis
LNRLTLVISSLLGGGAERVLTILANGWANRGTQVTIVTLDDGVPFHPLDARVSLRPLSVAGVSNNLPSAIRNNLRRVRRLRRAIVESRPDAVVSFADVTNVLTLLATRGLRIPVAVSERSDPAVCPIGTIFGFLRRLLYPGASAVIVQSEEARSFFSLAIRERAEVIPNPVLRVETARPAAREPTTHRKTVISLGRLSREKGFDLLIDAFFLVASEFPDWSLEIWGEGPERSNLEGRVAEKGLEGQVRLAGQTRSPDEKLSRADLFVLSSRFEGFPNGLCEAMACGLPVLAANCPSGPRQIVRDGVDGLLVEPGDPAALADGMRRLIEDPELRRRLAARAPEVADRFALDSVLDLWEAALGRAASRLSG